MARKIKKQELVAVAEEPNRVLEPEPLINTKGKVEQLKSDIKETGELVEPTEDELSDGTWVVLEELGVAYRPTWEYERGSEGESGNESEWADDDSSDGEWANDDSEAEEDWAGPEVNAEDADTPLIQEVQVKPNMDPELVREYLIQNDIRPIRHIGGMQRDRWLIHFASGEGMSHKRMDLGDDVSIHLMGQSQSTWEELDSGQNGEAEAEAGTGTRASAETKADVQTQPLGYEGLIRSGALKYDKSRYVRYKTEDGKRSVDSGDEVAQQLRGLDLDAVYAVAAGELGVDEGELKAKYGHLNPGMQRMNLGNRIRAAKGKGKK